MGFNSAFKGLIANSVGWTVCMWQQGGATQQQQISLCELARSENEPKILFFLLNLKTK
jgi:hypothetical protein